MKSYFPYDLLIIGGGISGSVFASKYLQNNIKKKIGLIEVGRGLGGRSSTRISNRFKGSKYANDAENRLVFLRNSMANHEIYIAEYYLKRGAFIASSERAKYMLETYPGAPASRDALIVLIESYNKLGSTNLAIETAKVLTANFTNYTYSVDKDKLVIVKDNSIDAIVEESSFFDFGLF